MAKKKNKQKSKEGPVSMDISTYSPTNGAVEAMDTSEVIASKSKLSVLNRNMKKMAPKRRGQLIRKAKAVEKAISNNEKKQEKIAKNQNKSQLVNTLKSLY